MFKDVSELIVEDEKYGAPTRIDAKAKGGEGEGTQKRRNGKGMVEVGGNKSKGTIAVDLVREGGC